MNVKRILLVVTIILLICTTASAEKVIIVMKNTPKTENLQTLKSLVLRKQEGIMSQIMELKKEGKVKSCKQLWIINAIAIDASKDVIKQIEMRKDVAKVVPDYSVEMLSSYNSEVNVKDPTTKIVVHSNNSNIYLGNITTIELYITNATGITGVHINVTYNNKVVELQDVSIKKYGGICYTSKGSSFYSFVLVFTNPFSIKNGLLAILKFKGSKCGSSKIDVYAELSDSNFKTIQPEIVGKCLSINVLSTSNNVNYNNSNKLNSTNAKINESKTNNMLSKNISKKHNYSENNNLNTSNKTNKNQIKSPLNKIVNTTTTNKRVKNMTYIKIQESKEKHTNVTKKISNPNTLKKIPSFSIENLILCLILLYIIRHRMI